MSQMNFYYWEEGGQIVVQNMIMGLEGQKHTHTKAGFKEWSKDIPKENLIKLN